MKEIGKVIEVENNLATVRIMRSTACGECGACQVGRDKLEMIMIVDNSVGAEIGDEVEVDMENVNFLTVMLIAYGFPLLALILGIFGGYYGIIALGLGEEAAQIFGAFFGLAALAISYAVIKYKEESIKKIKKFKPIIVDIKTKDNI